MEEQSLEQKLKKELDSLKAKYELEYHNTCGYYTVCVIYDKEELFWQYQRTKDDERK